jgi:hypothetical protein
VKKSHDDQESDIYKVKEAESEKRSVFVEDEAQEDGEQKM